MNKQELMKVRMLAFQKVMTDKEHPVKGLSLKEIMDRVNKEVEKNSK